MLQDLDGWIDALLEMVGPFSPVTYIRRLLRGSSDYPVHIWGADIREKERKLLGESDDRLPACGVGLSSAEALASALGEAYERYAFSSGDNPRALMDEPCSIPAPTVESLSVLPLLLSRETNDPKKIHGYLEKTRSWVRIIEWDRGRESSEDLYVPSSLIYAAHSTTELPASSNGMAAGPNLEFAALHGLYEVVERDAFIISWHHRYAGQCVDESKLLPKQVVDWIGRLRQINIDFRIHDISTELGFFIFLGYVVQRKEGRAISFSCGAGCGLNPRVAAKRAFLEAALSWKGARELVVSKGLLGEEEQIGFRPATFSDHLFLYQHQSMMGAVDFLLKQDISQEEYADAYSFASPAEELNSAVNKLSEKGYTLYMLDMTPSEVAAINIRVVRSIVPGLVPLCWGDYYPLPTKRLVQPEHINPNSWAVERNMDPHPFP
ncbi:MAG TPA: YcaO-like family protein [candidate division Zixibacteria bacterium]|nr:YcaO-like family protein [candidate division Zixibacteria bacterium]